MHNVGGRGAGGVPNHPAQLPCDARPTRIDIHAHQTRIPCKCTSAKKHTRPQHANHPGPPRSPPSHSVRCAVTIRSCEPSALVLRLLGEESLLPASCHCCPANSSKTFFSKMKSIGSRRGGRGRGPPTELAQGTRSAACAARGQAISPPGARCLRDRPILALVQAPNSFQIAPFDIRTLTSTVGPATFRPAAETKLGGSLAVPQKLWDRSGGRSLAAQQPQNGDVYFVSIFVTL
jgi:hypothetical protein